LLVAAADTAASREAQAIAGGGAPGTVLLELLQDMDTLLADPARRLDAGPALLYIGDDYFQVAREVRTAEQLTQLQQLYFAFLDALELDARQSDTVRLLSAARRLQVSKALQDTQQVPAAIAARERATLDAFLARDYDANARAGIVNSASWVLSELGDDARLRSLLEEQMQASRTPYYYMPDVADIEERAGNKLAALQWLERGYRESRGPATRFQWGVLYLQGLLRMSPQDEPRVRATALALLAELDGPDRIHARTRTRLEQLGKALTQWAGQSGNAATLEAIAERWRGVCEQLPAGAPERPDCARLPG
jgi:protein disulfide-isomerase